MISIAISFAIVFAKFCLLVSPVVLVSVLILRWLDRRKLRRLKRNFREAYQDWKGGNDAALNFARQWHFRISSFRR